MKWENGNLKEKVFFIFLINKNLLPKNFAPIANKERSIIRLVIDGEISKTFLIKSNKPNTPPSVTPF